MMKGRMMMNSELFEKNETVVEYFRFEKEERKKSLKFSKLKQVIH